MTTSTEMHVRKGALADIAAVPRAFEPDAGQALFKIERFALTANNVTYAAHGEDMGYWGFYPAPDGFGIVPVWGFADVAASRVAGLNEGERFYGYWPMASHALLTPGKVSPGRFTDMAANRQALAPVYNGYTAASDAFGDERIQMLFRPLYTTSFVLDAMLSASPAKTLILTSASSKTALGLAQAAKARGVQKVIGLTSPANRGFVGATGYYDRVAAYSMASTVDGDAAALIDFSGNGEVRRAVHAALGKKLIESHVVGDTNWDAANTNKLPGVAPQFFFAPTVIAERIKEWGAGGFEARLAAGWASFVASATWLRLVEDSGPDAVARYWRALVKGDVDPADGIILGM